MRLFVRVVVYSPMISHPLSRLPAIAASTTLWLAANALYLGAAEPVLPYPIVDSGQDHCYDNKGEMIPPKPGQPFHGQDANFRAHPANYTISTDGLTAKDNVTGLTWQRVPETNNDGTLTHADKLTFEDALAQPAKLNAARFGGFSDWRVPGIKEIYSLFDCRGTDPSGYQGTDTSGLRPFLDAKAFTFIYGDVANGARIIDSQYASATKYVGKSARGGDKVFGVNFADGRIKGYDQAMPGGKRKFKFFVLCVRGNPDYGKNDFKDNGNGSVSDRATGLTWSKADSGKGMDWEHALAWVQQKNAEKFLGHDDWRMPSVKELQSIVDYTKSPDTSNSPAIDPVLTCSRITNEGGKPDYPCYWSGSTHVGHLGGAAAMYVAFGRAGGFLSARSLAGGPPARNQGGPPGPGQQSEDDGPYTLVDVHGAGAQRSDPKTGDPKMFPHGRGPQGDVVRIFNHVRLVRGGEVTTRTPAQPSAGTTNPGKRPAAGPPSGAPSPGPSGGAAGRQSGFPMASPIITALDGNQNGIIEANELAKAAEALKALDKNKDDQLTSDEYRPQMPGGPGGQGGGFPGAQGGAGRMPGRPGGGAGAPQGPPN